MEIRPGATYSGLAAGPAAAGAVTLPVLVPPIRPMSFTPLPPPAVLAAAALVALAAAGCAAPTTPRQPSPSPAHPVATAAVARAGPAVCVVDPWAPHGLQEVAGGFRVVDGDTLLVGSPEWEATLGSVTVLSDSELPPGTPLLLAGPPEVVVAYPEEEPRTMPAEGLTLLGLAPDAAVYAARSDLADPGLLLSLHADGPISIEEVANHPAGWQTLRSVATVYLPLRRIGCVFVAAALETERLYAAAARPDDEEEVVTFPPTPSAHLLLPDDELSGAGTVGAAARQLHDRLAATGHGHILFVPVPGGLAVVAAAPRADAGDPPDDDEERPLLASVFSSLVDLARQLFQGRPGEHRAIAFVLSDRNWNFDAGGSDLVDLEEWEAGGGLAPPARFDTIPLSPEHRLIAALYVFRQATVDDPPGLVRDPGLSVRGYLEDVGLFTPDREEP